jgi:hypothetical protein
MRDVGRRLKPLNFPEAVYHRAKAAVLMRADRATEAILSAARKMNKGFVEARR